MTLGPNIDTAGQIPDLCLICNDDTNERVWVGHSAQPSLAMDLIDQPACFVCAQELQKGGALAVNYLVAERDRLAQMVIDRVRLNHTRAILEDIQDDE